MAPMQKASDIKARFRNAVVARKKADNAAVKTRGKELLAVLRKHAKQDLEALEAQFLSHNDVLPVIEKIEDFGDFEAQDGAQ